MISLEFNDGSILNYTFNDASSFKEPFNTDKQILACKMIFQAIDAYARYDKSGLYVFEILVKINDHIISHDQDIINLFNGLPVFNEGAAYFICRQFSAPQENTEIKTLGEVTNPEFDLG